MTNKLATRSVTLAVTGASGTGYALRLLETLLSQHVHVNLLISDPGRMVLAQESNIRLPSKPSEIASQLSERFAARDGDLRVFSKDDWFAPIASGSNPADAMVVCPCTTGTLAEIAAGTSRSLIERAADVTIKENRQLILVIRETPFSVIHLQNMLSLAQAGVVIMPANPGFYQASESIQDVIDYMVARILDHLKVEHDLMARWGADRC